MLFPQRLEKARDLTARHCRPAADSSFCIFLSVSDGSQRALVVHGVAAAFDEAWRRASAALQAGMEQRGMAGRWLRIDWVERLHEVSIAELHARLKATPRGGFRQGICFDLGLERPLLEQELNANAILQDSMSECPHAVLNVENLGVYAGERFGTALDCAAAESVLLLDTRGIFPDGSEQHLLVAKGPGTGRRHFESMTPDLVGTLIDNASRYLSRQVDEAGRFTYGYYPCFDRPIPTYNMVRHAGTVYAMIEAWQEKPDGDLKAAIDRALKFLIRDRVAVMEASNGTEFAMLVDTGNEIKLGGNALLILALSEYSRAFDAGYVLPMAERLARGITRMQEPSTGRFMHVLNFPDLSVKAENRIIYYDGEATFALTRLYGCTNDSQWLKLVKHSAAYFIDKEYWQHRDHWISYFTNELTLHNPDPDYVLLGIRNLKTHLDWSAKSKALSPTSLELLTAARQMLSRLESGGLSYLLDQVDLAGLDEALDRYAGRMLDNYFWPETAMYFRHPDRICGSFYAREDSFRVRIDDVQHSISGLVAYRRIIAARAGARDRVPMPSR